MNTSIPELSIDKKLLSIAKHHCFPETAVHIIINDLLLRVHPNDDYDYIVSFEALILFFLISTNKEISLPARIPKSFPLEKPLRSLLSELESSFFKFASDDFPDEEPLIQRLQKHVHSQSVSAASFLYSGDEAYPSQYLDLIPQRYALDEEWFVENIGISLGKLYQCMWYLLYESSVIREDTEPEKYFLLVHLDNIPQQLNDSLPIFIKLFSTDLNNTKEFSLKNILLFQAKPIIKINELTLLLPPPIILLQAVCESPIYWMGQDKTYAQTAWKHRGETTVNMVFHWMRSVFGRENVFKNVLIQKGKQHITDIDILVTFQNKVIVFQVKSKKMTLETKLGDREKFINDFNKSIQDAYDQAISSIKSIQARDCTFLYENSQIELPKNINDFYIFCVTTEQFKTLNTRFEESIKIDSQLSSIPIIPISTFDLQVLTLYLYNPYDFLYYLHRRKEYLSKIILSEEINILIAFLENGLRKIPVDKVIFGNDFLDSLNEHFRPWPTKELIKKSYKWKRENKEQIISSIENWKYQTTNDLITCIYDNYEILTISVLQNLNRMNKERIFQLLNRPQDLLSTLFLLDKKIGRNEKCPCGSGLKYKRCCGK